MCHRRGESAAQGARQRVFLCDLESAELAHAPALVDDGADSLDVRSLVEPISLGRLVNAEKILSVLGSDKVG